LLITTTRIPEDEEKTFTQPALPQRSGGVAPSPPIEKVLERIRERKATAGTRLSPEEILASRDADRR
jgi:hypothetical protein